MEESATDWIERFLHHLHTERRLSGQTCLHYRRDLLELAAWCRDNGVSHWRQLDTHQVRQYAARAHRRGLSGRSIQRRLSALRTFFNYLLRERAAIVNPGLDVRAPRSGRHLPDTLNVDDVTRLLGVTDREPRTLRDIARL